MEDSNGIVIHNNVYSHYMQLSSDYISLMKNNLWALAKGSDIITDFEFESLKKLSNECIALCKQGVWGVVSICENSLTQLLPYKFNEIELLSDKYFVAKFALGNSQVSQLFDVHEMGIDLQTELAKDYPGFKLNLHPMEENGNRCDWNRGLAHGNGSTNRICESLCGRH